MFLLLTLFFLCCSSGRRLGGWGGGGFYCCRPVLLLSAPARVPIKRTRILHNCSGDCFRRGCPNAPCWSCSFCCCCCCRRCCCCSRDGDHNCTKLISAMGAKVDPNRRLERATEALSSCLPSIRAVRMVILPSYSSTYPRLRFPQLLLFCRRNNPKVCIFDVPLVAHVPLWYGRSQETLSRGVLPRVFV